MDIVHAHYVRNLNEGIAQLDGTSLYSPSGEAGYQPYWDSMNFDYARDGVQHMLLSNVKYWIDEFHFDGYRFDGVTSMLYHHFGYTDFDSRQILRLGGQSTNYNIPRARQQAATLAQGGCYLYRRRCERHAPGMCLPIDDGGVGFDYRLAGYTRLLDQATQR